jgi:hypothetical protein
MNLIAPSTAEAQGIAKAVAQADQPAAPYQGSRNTSGGTIRPVQRKEELAGRLDLPGRPGGLKKPIAQQSEKDMFRNVPER